MRLLRGANSAPSNAWRADDKLFADEAPSGGEGGGGGEGRLDKNILGAAISNFQPHFAPCDVW